MKAESDEVEASESASWRWRRAVRLSRAERPVMVESWPAERAKSWAARAAASSERRLREKR